MTDAPDVPRQFAVIDHADGGAQPAGVVSMAADGMLAIVSAEPQSAYKLDMAVNNLNAMQSEQVEAAAPPGTPRYTLYARAVDRASPEFAPALIEHLRSGYELELRSL